jgi:hypothetical protein
MRNVSGKSHVLAGAVISDIRRTQKIRLFHPFGLLATNY